MVGRVVGDGWSGVGIVVMDGGRGELGKGWGVRVLVAGEQCGLRRWRTGGWRVGGSSGGMVSV